MLFDRVTEEIAHFVGMFLLAELPGQPDPDYDPFLHFRLQQPIGPLTGAAPDHNHAYGPEGYMPFGGALGADAFGGWPSLLDGAHGVAFLRTPPFVGVAPVQTRPDPDFAQPERPMKVEMPPVGDGPMPAAYATVTVQSNFLTDRDVLSVDPARVLEWHALQDVRLIDLAHAAAWLTPLDLGTYLVAGYPGLAGVEALMLEAEAYADAHGAGSTDASSAPSDPTLHYFGSGASATGAYLNGASVGSLPVATDTLPTLPEITEIGTLGSGYFRIGDGSVSAITGGNFALNTATHVHQRVDAPVIIVGGDVVSLDYVSQINILQDDGDAEEAAGQTVLQNGAEIGASTTGGPQIESLLLSRTGQTPDVVFMTSIEGDLVNYSWTTQSNMADDSDAVTVSGGNSWILTGQNQLINAEQLLTTGLGYDLILVGGDMISVFAVSQTNVLLDVDAVPDTDPEAASTSPIPTTQTPASSPSDAGTQGAGPAVAPAASATPTIPTAEAAPDAKQVDAKAESGPAPVGMTARKPASDEDHVANKTTAPTSEASPSQRDGTSGTGAGKSGSDTAESADVPADAAKAPPAAAPVEKVSVSATPGNATEGAGMTSVAGKDGTAASISKVPVGTEGEGPDVAANAPEKDPEPSHAEDATGKSGGTPGKSDAPPPPTDTEDLEEGDTSDAPSALTETQLGPVAPAPMAQAQTTAALSEPEADAEPQREPVKAPTSDPATTQPEEEDPGEEGPIGPGTHDNALINSVSIVHTAVDTVNDDAAALRTLIEALDPEAPDLTELVSSPIFAGMETMSVLHITGDLVNVHAIEQKNFVADSDLLEGPAAAEAIAGGNALVNNVSLIDVGIESHVMAGGEVYSEAFLHQAELLLDADSAAPPGAGPEALATEAVAFLAEGMESVHAAFGGRMDGDEGGFTHANIGDAGPPADIMQSYLA